MKSYARMVDAGRRKFLTGAGVVAAGVAAATVCLPGPKAPRRPRGWTIRRTGSRMFATSRSTSPCSFLSRRDAPGVLLKLGKRVPTGVGPDGDIVGFSTICPHKGFPLNYNKSDHTLNCPGHYSRFDCDAGGQQIWGQATQNLPQYMLRIDANGDIYAEASTSCCTAGCPTCSEGGTHGLQASDRPSPDHSRRTPRVQRHLPLLHRRLRLQGVHLGREQAGRHGRRTRTSSASTSASSSAPSTAAWYSPVDVQLVQQNGEDVHIVIKPDKTAS